MSLANYLTAVRKAIEAQQGDELRALFRFDSNAALTVMQLAQRGAVLPTADVQRQIPSSWSDIVLSYLQALFLSSHGEALAACKEFRDKHAKMILDVLKETAWVVPVVLGMAVTLKQLSERADDEQARKGANRNQVNSLGTFLQQVWSSTASSKGNHNESKRQAAVGVACIMMKVYFRCNTISNCSKVIENIESTLKNHETAPAAHRVTFRYYTGRLAAYDEDYKRADEHLTYAFEHCHREAMGNKRKVLRFLIPVRMLRGILPSNQLLETYQLQEYLDIKEAVMAGDVSLLLRSLHTNQVLFVQAGTYLLLEKLLLSTYRRLFRKVAVLHAEMNPSKANQLPLAMLHKALEIQGLEKDNAELQCILANLIYRKYIKGYIAYKPKVLVLAKTDAFPDLSQVLLGDPFTL